MRFARLALATMAAFGLTAACASEQDAQPAATSAAGVASPPTDAGQPRAALAGVSLSPRSFDSEDFTSFLDEISGRADVLTWGGYWRDLADETSAPHVIVQLAEQYGYEPIVMISTHANQHHDGATSQSEPYSDSLRAEYVETVRAFVALYKPRYFGIGAELNRLASIDSVEYGHSAQLFEESAAAVSTASPETAIFTAFQLEWMQGLQGGLFGGRNDPSQAQWGLIDDFAAATIVCFTTYPGLIFGDPADIPEDYYAAIRDHTDAPIAFTEVGWPAGGTAPGFTSTPEEQTEFVVRYQMLTEPLPPRFSIWSFYFDQPLGEPFGEMGLVTRDGAPRPARDAWFALP